MTALAATVEHSPSLLDSFDVSRLWSPSFPSPDLVAAAAALLTPLPTAPGRLVRVADRPYVFGQEGPVRRLIVSPGSIRVGSSSPARAERAAARAVEAARVAADLAALELEREGSFVDAPSRAILSWSKRSRSRMVERLSQLDYGPLFASGGVPAMVTLTYPGDWQTVCQDAQASQRHLRAFCERYRRTWGARIVGVWKREFQRRGAPHFHILMVPPRGEVNGEGFSAWLSRTWAEVVGHPDPAEFARHLAAGTGVDYAEGMRSSDPRRVAVYFTKHGAYSDKEYQNEAPAEWLETGKSIGRFWGRWGLEVATATVELSHVEAYAAARVLRRWSRANGYVAKREVWRADTTTGVYRRRRVSRRSGRMPGHLGFVTLNDAPAFLSTLARHLDDVREDAQRAELVALGHEPWFGCP